MAGTVPLLCDGEAGATSASMYFLSEDCYVCNTQGYWIVLNISRDQYLCVTHADLASIGSQIHGWQYGGGSLESCQNLDDGRDRLINSLLVKGILTSNSSQGKAFVESENATGQIAVALPTSTGPVKVRFLAVAQFFLACAKIDWCLRKGKLPLALTMIKQRRLRVRSSTRLLEDSKAIEVIAAFKDLRPLYPRPYLCLFDSLALLEFLAGHSSYPRIVFGVVADPFQAHCWLEEGSVLLNDDPERVGRYKPIMSV